MIEVQTKTEQNLSLEGEVERDIEAFNAWFQKQTGSEPLVRSEVAILKTYLWYKLRGETHGSADAAGPVEGSHGA